MDESRGNEENTLIKFYLQVTVVVVDESCENEQNKAPDYVLPLSIVVFFFGDGVVICKRRIKYGHNGVLPFK